MKNKPMLLLILALVGCGENTTFYDTQISDAHADSTRDTSESSIRCQDTTTVYPEWEQRATLVSNTTNGYGVEQQEVNITVLSPVILETESNTGHRPEVVINSVVQNTMISNGTRVGLFDVVTQSQNRCGYVYKLRIGFASIGCEQRTCYPVRPGQTLRFSLNTCFPTTSVCVSGAQQELTVISSL